MPLQPSSFSIFFVWDARSRQRTDGALVRLITPVYPNAEEPWWIGLIGLGRNGIGETLGRFGVLKRGPGACQPNLRTRSQEEIRSGF
jgi:hypothetical protein